MTSNTDYSWLILTISDKDSLLVANADYLWLLATNADSESD